MAEAILAPDCAQMVIAHLGPLVGVPVSSSVPRTRPAEFVRVSQIPSAGFEDVILYSGAVVVETWAATKFRALELARYAHSYLIGAPFFVDPDGPGEFPPDPDTGTPKAGFRATVYARGTVL